MSTSQVYRQGSDWYQCKGIGFRLDRPEHYLRCHYYNLDQSVGIGTMAQEVSSPSNSDTKVKGSIELEFWKYVPPSWKSMPKETQSARDLRASRANRPSLHISEARGDMTETKL